MVSIIDWGCFSAASRSSLSALASFFASPIYRLLDSYGITSLIIRTNGDINAVSGYDIKASGVTDADILAAYGKGLLREAAADQSTGDTDIRSNR